MTVLPPTQSRSERPGPPPIARQPLLPERKQERRSQRLVAVLLVSLTAHGLLLTAKIVQGLDLERVERVVRPDPMRVRAAYERRVETQRKQQEEQARERERERDEPRPEPPPAPTLEVEVEDEPEPEPAPDDTQLDADPAAEAEPGDGGRAGPQFGGSPVGDGHLGPGGGPGSGGSGIALGSGDGRPRPKSRPPSSRPSSERDKPQSKRKRQRDRRARKRESKRPPPESTPPKPHPRNRSPVYPERLRTHNITGTVGIRLHIDAEGRVRGAKILRARIKGAANEKLEDRAKQAFKKAVIDAVKTWSFKPATEKGKPVAIWYPMSFDFELK